MAELKKEIEKTATGVKFFTYVSGIIPGMLLVGVGYRMASHPGSTVTLVTLGAAAVLLYGISRAAENHVLGLSDRQNAV